MIKFFNVLLFLLLFNVSYAQDYKDVNVSAKFKSPRTTQIIDLLLNRDDVYKFCNDYYNLYYTEIEDSVNVYYVVEKINIQDSIQKNSAVSISSMELKVLLFDESQKEKVFIVPIY